MVYPIENFERVWVRGRFVDLAKAAREEANYGLTGPVQFVPKATVTLNYASQQIIAMKPFVVWPDATTGYFQIQLPVTDDPDVNPTDFKYEVTEPTGRKYHIKVPIDTPTLFDPGDPLDGQQVIELVNVVPDPENPDGTVQLLKGLTGRGIESVEFRTTDDHLIIHYDDGLTEDVGIMPGVHSVAGRAGDVTLTKADVGLSSVDNVSAASLRDRSTHTGTQAISSVSGLQTALDGKAAVSHSHVAADLPRVLSPVVASSGSGTISTDASACSIRNHTATGNVTIAVPTNPTDRQVIKFAVLAQTLTRTVSIAAGIRTSTSLTRGPYSVGAGEVFFGALEYSSLAGAWVLTAATVSAV